MDVKECCALGRSGYLGQFYDVREEKFCSGSMFSTLNLPSSCVKSVNISSVNVEYTFEDSYTKRFEKLDVNAELKLSVFAGLLDLKGSGKYLTDDKAGSRSVRGTILYNVNTVEEKVNIYDEELKKYFTLDALTNTSATHFVGGIVWGANTFASFEYRKCHNRDLTRITKNLGAELQALVAEVKENGDANYLGLNENHSLTYDMKIYGDVIPTNEELPKTRDEAMNLLRKTPTYISNCNNGKGKPITFILYPLSEVTKMLNIKLQSNVRIYRIDFASVLQTEQIFNDLLLTKQVFNDFYEALSSPSAPYFSTATIQDINKFKNHFETAELNLRTEFRKALIKTRSDPSQSFCVQDVLKNFKGGEFTPDSVRAFLTQHGGLQEKMDFISDLKANNVKYMICRSFDVDCIRSKEKYFYALVFEQTYQIYNSQKWKDNINLFMQLLLDKQNTEPKVYYALEIVNATGEVSDQVEESKVSIYLCRDHIIESEDLFKDRLIANTFALARSIEYDFGSYVPNKFNLLKVRCPGSIYGICGAEVVKWKCHQSGCTEYLYYGFDSFVYCTNCGKAKLSTLSYKCTDKNHGPYWLLFQRDEDVLRMITELVAAEEINILIIGETGVGKSTFINAFANYLTYDNLDEAEQKDFVALVSTSFTVTDYNFQEKLVKFGEDPNESGLTGQSQTQSCCSYTFPMGDKLIRLIDTPGIGDTSGPDMDMKNFENIISYIAKYSVLHGICILLKSNNSRVSVMFRFSIQDLLSHIHKGASENIVFVFTNSRGTFYRPGDTLPSLRTLLEENATKPPHVQIPLNKATVYCLDNESFRFLVASKNEITFRDDEKINFRSSWGRSVTECVRMLDHFSKIKPHSIHDTISLNDARRLILFLSKPLCDINQNIQNNILAIENQELKIQEAEENIAKLQEDLLIPTIQLEQRFFGEPRFVCTSEKCVTVRTVDGKKTIDYSRVCPKPPQVTFPFFENNNNFLSIFFPEKFYCIVCGCHESNHKFINYENVVITKEKVDSDVQGKIKIIEEQKLQRTRVLQDCQIRRDKLQMEQDEINQVCAQFAHFLQCNAIIPYNDALKYYLEHLINVESQKCAYDPDNQAIVNELKNMMEIYLAQVNILEFNFNAGGQIPCAKISPDMINYIINQLYSLELSGSSIKDAYENQRVQLQSSQIINERMYRPVRSHHHYKDEDTCKNIENSIQDNFNKKEELD